MRSLVAVALDFLLAPLILLAAPVCWIARRVGLHRLPLGRLIFTTFGVLPLRRHYYDPYVDQSLLRMPTDVPRVLPGVDLREAEQLELLSELSLSEEVAKLGSGSGPNRQFRFGNGSFESGDAEFLYQFVRVKRPRRVVEIGSGNSSLVVRDALAANRAADPHYSASHVCIEPYEMPWLEASGISTVRKLVQDIPVNIFEEMEAGDLLFIDSSHVIRPQGDVLTEYLQILPRLKRGVYVHIHDIFTPRDYPREWMLDRMWLWNEQYMVEAMLSAGTSWKIVAALNFLKHSHYDALKTVCPFLSPDREPGSLYVMKT